MEGAQSWWGLQAWGAGGAKERRGVPCDLYMCICTLIRTEFKYTRIRVRMCVCLCVDCLYQYKCIYIYVQPLSAQCTFQNDQGVLFLCSGLLGRIWTPSPGLARPQTPAGPEMHGWQGALGLCSRRAVTALTAQKGGSWGLYQCARSRPVPHLGPRDRDGKVT